MVANTHARAHAHAITDSQGGADRNRRSPTHTISGPNRHSTARPHGHAHSHGYSGSYRHAGPSPNLHSNPDTVSDPAGRKRANRQPQRHCRGQR